MPEAGAGAGFWDATSEEDASVSVCMRSPISAGADDGARNLLQRGPLRTPAVQAAVTSARATDEHELVAQRRARTVQANGGVVGSEAFLAGHLGNARAIDVHPADETRVGGLERFRQRGDAVAHGLLQIRLFINRAGELSLGKSSLLSCRPPAHVGDRVAEKPVEPRDTALVVANAVAPLGPLQPGP